MANIVRSRYPETAFQPGSLPEFVLKELEAYGNKPALISPKLHRSYTFAELIVLSRRLAHGLHSQVGLRRGHVLSACLANHMEFIPLMLGVGLLGATVNTANPAYTVRELVQQFEDCRTRCVVTTADTVGKIKAVKEKCKLIGTIITLDHHVDGCLYLPDLMEHTGQGFVFPKIDPGEDIAFLLNSSGTTGVPKAVMLTHRTVVSNLCQVSARFMKGISTGLFSPTIDDIALPCFPLFHVGGIVLSVLWMLLNGATVLILDRYDPVTFLNTIRAYKVTIILVPPPVLIHYVKSPTATVQDFESVKYVLCGAAAIHRTLSEAVAEKMKPDYIVQIYGATELSPVATMSPVLPTTWQKHGSCGVLISNTQGKVIDIKSGEALGPQKYGEICIKGPQVMKGYLNNQKATNDTIDSEGWLHTGDVGCYDEDGYFYVVDRIKDTMKVKGFQVSPAELEALLLTHSSIEDAVVIGYPDAYAGELPRAYVVLKRGAQLTEEDVKKFVETVLHQPTSQDVSAIMVSSNGQRARQRYGVERGGNRRSRGGGTGTGPAQESTTTNAAGQGTQPVAVQCRHCGRKGHQMDECYTLATAKQRRYNNRGKSPCDHCGAVGHIRADCRNYQAAKRALGSQEPVSLNEVADTATGQPQLTKSITAPSAVGSQQAPPTAEGRAVACSPATNCPTVGSVDLEGRAAARSPATNRTTDPNAELAIPPKPPGMPAAYWDELAKCWRPPLDQRLKDLGV